MFDIGWGEFVVIAVVALIVIGPKELPAVLRAIGQWTTKIRRMASEFQSQFQEALREAEMADLKKEVDSLNDTARGFTSQFDDPLNFKEATKWEPKPEAAKTEPTEPAADNPDSALKPADTPPQSELVTPDGYAVPVTDTPAIEKIPVSADQPAIEQALPPSAAEATPAPSTIPARQPSVAEGSGQKGEGDAHS
jgi:sec-independent protein translocase protein TatB